MSSLDDVLKYWTTGYPFDNPDDEEETEILAEFEKMLNGESNNYSSLRKEPKPSIVGCTHIWEHVGNSPVLDTPWYNCKKCGIAKEKYEKSKQEK